MTEIISASNSRFKYFKNLLTKKGRAESGEYMVEGFKSVYDAVNSERDVTAVIICDKLTDRIPECDAEIIVMPQQLTDRLSDTKTPQGIYAVIKSETKKFTPGEGKAYVYCDNISDPGNLGTIIRTADSAGFDGVLLSPGCVEVYNPKTVRSCMGSFFHVDIYENIGGEILETFKECGGRIFAGLLSGNTVDYREPDYSGSIIIAVGNEANGVGETVKNLCSPVKIPIYGNAESLNAAVAASIMMYEAANKRN